MQMTSKYKDQKRQVQRDGEDSIKQEEERNKKEVGLGLIFSNIMEHNDH